MDRGTFAPGPRQDGRVSTMGSRLRYTLVASTYVLTVAAVATQGFTTESTGTILLAAFLALPSSAVAVPAYYAAYGLLALVPGANPSSSTGSASCSSAGDCQTSTSGDLADWFALTTDVVGILALTAAAVLNVIVLRIVILRRRAQTQTPTQRGQ